MPGREPKHGIGPKDSRAPPIVGLLLLPLSNRKGCGAKIGTQKRTLVSGNKD